MKRQIQFQIPAEWEGTSSVDFLAARFPYHSKEEWRQLLLNGRVHVNDRVADAGLVLHTNDRIEYVSDGIPEPPVNRQIEIIHDDRDILIVNKPPNLPCHPGGRYFNNTLWAVLKARHGVESPIFVNRLDRETSGLVVIARTEEAGRRCRRQFSDRTVEKRYIALVNGRFPASLAAHGRLVMDPASPVRKARRFIPDPDPAPSPGAEVAPEQEGETAETRFRLISIHGPISQIEAIPGTGRLHQIRATLHALGFPLVGDKLYGPDPMLFIRFCQGTLSPEDLKILQLPRQALHACGLTMRHPRTGTRREFEAPLPKDLIDFLSSCSD